MIKHHENDSTRKPTDWLRREATVFREMTNRTRKTLLYSGIALAIIAAAIVSLVILRKASAPQAVRLLPEADAVVYVDIKSVRRLTSFELQPKPPHDPAYEQFIRETGFEFERDLDEAAFAVHSGGSGHENRYSEVFVGHYDAARVSAYLKKASSNVEHYEDTDIYNVPVENRTVRVALLGIDSAAISNSEDASIIRGMIDRHKKIGNPFGGPSLVAHYYKHVPLTSLVWGIVQIPSAPKDTGTARSMTLPGGIDIFVPSASTMVASIRFLTDIHAKAEFFTSSEADSKHFVDQAGAFLALFQSLQSSAQLSGRDPDVKAVFESIKVEQKGTRAILSADIPLGFLKKLFSESPTELAPQMSQPEQPPSKAEEKSPAKKSPSASKKK